MAGLPRLCSVSIHAPTHTTEEVILNPDIFGDLAPGELLQICNPADPSNRLIVRVPLTKAAGTNRLEISVLKSISDAVGFKQFSRVVVDRISEDEGKVDFVELSFRRQYLQRGNMFRFKSALIGRTIHMNQNISVSDVQAQIQDVRLGSTKRVSGVVTQDTKFVFRSKSSRVIWLVQISAEMWDFDMNGDLYFEKFLNEFVSPVLDSWKSLGVSHMLTVIFFCRTFYLDRVTLGSHPELYAKKSFVKNSNGFYQQDFFKIVLENVADIDKMAHIKVLRKQFWDFAQCIGWKACRDPERELASRLALSGTASEAQLNYVLPSDAVHGNVLESINSALNILDKHYMDRDLQRTGNCIVLISVGSGLFKVKPNLAQITKQRMLDNAFGIDLVSLSRPPVHSVPLFLVDCKAEGHKDFYEVPHWIRVAYVDCRTSSLRLNDEVSAEDQEILETWSSVFAPPPISSLLTSILMSAEDLRTLTAGYVRAMPQSLRQYITVENAGDFACEPSAGVETALGSALNSQARCVAASVPQWGVLPLASATPQRKHAEGGFSSKSVFYQRDLLNLKAVALSRSPPFNKRLYVDIFESLPAMKHEREAAESLTSEDELSKSIENSSLDNFLVDIHGNMTDRFSVRTSACKHALLDATMQIKKIRDEVLLGGETSVEKLEELFFQHDSALFRPPQVAQPTPPPNAVAAASAAPSPTPPKPTAPLPTKPVMLDRHRVGLGPRGPPSRELQEATHQPPRVDTSPSPPPESPVTVTAATAAAAAVSKSRLSSRNFVARNEFQTARNMQTKLALVQGSNKPGVVDAAASKKAGNSEYLQDYCKANGINPFRQKEGKKHLTTVSHNRRRWSHVFPVGRTQIADFGLNWKSLTQPAILPLNTDYLPTISELRTRYTVHQYTIQFIKECSPFETLEDALRELVCQRLSQEFQLIEGLDQIPYMRLNHYDILASNAQAKPTGDGSFRNFFILTMGHRIQFLYGDSANSQISITQYVSNQGKNTASAEVESDKTSFTYRYEMWMPQRDRFETIVQSFHQFPTPEIRWNLIDNTIAGTLAYDCQDLTIKTRRLKYSVVPCAVQGPQDVDMYYAQMDLLLDFLRKYQAVTKDDPPIAVTKDSMLSMLDPAVVTPSWGRVSYNQHPTVHRRASSESLTAKLFMRGPKHANPNWVYLRYDRCLYGFKAFHFEFHWNVCDSWLVDEFVSLLYRRCSKWALRLVQTPEYFSTPNLSVHPFKALPYVQLPDCAVKVPAPFPSVPRLLERCLFGRSQGWVYDSEQVTEWAKIGVVPPNYADRDRDLLSADFDALAAAASAPGEGASTKATSWSLPFQRAAGAETAPATALEVALGGRQSSVRLDRQYMHVSGLAVVRMAANGFIWMQNSAARISDAPDGPKDSPRPAMTLGEGAAAATAEERVALATRMMHDLQRLCTAGVDCYELVLALVDDAIAAADALVPPVPLSLAVPTVGAPVGPPAAPSPPPPALDDGAAPREREREPYAKHFPSARI